MKCIEVMKVSRKILMIVGDFVEDYEVMVPFQALQVCGCEVTAVSPGRKSGEQIRTAIHDFEGDQTYTEKRGHNFTLNGAFADVSADGFDALVLPGGRSPEHLRLNGRVLELIRAFAEAGKPVAAVCHGPQLLTAAGVVKGRKINAYPAVKPEIEAAGAEYVDAGFTGAVTDGMFVTAPAWSAHVEWLKQFLAVLNA